MCQHVHDEWIYKCVFVSLCVCVCVRGRHRERKRHKERGSERERNKSKKREKKGKGRKSKQRSCKRNMTQTKIISLPFNPQFIGQRQKYHLCHTHMLFQWFTKDSHIHSYFSAILCQVGAVQSLIQSNPTRWYSDKPCLIPICSFSFMWKHSWSMRPTEYLKMMNQS